MLQRLESFMKRIRRLNFESDHPGPGHLLSLWVARSLVQSHGHFRAVRTGIIGWRNRLYCQASELSKRSSWKSVATRYRADLLTKNASLAIIGSHWQVLHLLSIIYQGWKCLGLYGPRLRLALERMKNEAATDFLMPRLFSYRVYWSKVGCEWQLIKFLIGSLTIQQDQIVGNKLGRHRKTVSLDSHVRIGWPRQEFLWRWNTNNSDEDRRERHNFICRWIIFF